MLFVPTVVALVLFIGIGVLALAVFALFCWRTGKKFITGTLWYALIDLVSLLGGIAAAIGVHFACINTRGVALWQEWNALRVVAYGLASVLGVLAVQGGLRYVRITRHGLRARREAQYACWGGVVVFAGVLLVAAAAMPALGLFLMWFPFCGMVADVIHGLVFRSMRAGIDSTVQLEKRMHSITVAIYLVVGALAPLFALLDAMYMLMDEFAFFVDNMGLGFLNAAACAVVFAIATLSLTPVTVLIGYSHFAGAVLGVIELVVLIMCWAIPNKGTNYFPDQCHGGGKGVVNNE